MSADLLALLDQLDEARAAATPGPWHWDQEFGEKNDTGLALTNDAGAEIVGAYNTHCCDFRDDPTVEDADAALIVAAVNALPELISELRKHDAALRAVESLIDPETGMATGNGYDATRLFEEKDIRRALDADALTPEQVQP